MAAAQNSDPEKMEECEEEGIALGEDEEEDGIQLGEDEEDFDIEVGTTYSCQRQDGSYHDAEVTKIRQNKRAGREEYYVHYIGLTARQNEWVDKSRLERIKELEEEPLEEEMEEQAEELEEEPPNGNEEEAPEDAPPENEEDEPKSKKMKVEIDDSSVVEDIDEEFTCLLCSKLFQDPVVIECGHNFCRCCFEDAWVDQDSFTCPDCNEVLSEKRFTVNRILANLVKKTAAASSTPTFKSPARVGAKEKGRPPENCPDHEERLKLFCKDDGDLGCVICRESLKHSDHNFLPILDAVTVYRKDLSSIVTPLEDALKLAEKTAKEQSERISKHKESMEDYQEHIESEFRKLHSLLQKQEDELLEKLKEEGESILVEMEANVAKMQENVENIKQSLVLATEKLADTDSISFLTDIKTFVKKCQEQQKEASSIGNNLIDKELSAEIYKAPINFPVPQGTVSASASSSVSVAQKPKEIWIIGNYYVTKAAKVAKNGPYGQNLGLDKKAFTVRWMDSLAQRWRSLSPEMYKADAAWGPPSIVFIHLGSSDLGQEKNHLLISDVKRDLSRFVRIFPKTVFIWSEILPRMHWMNSQIDHQRKQFNTVVVRAAEQIGVLVADLSEVEMMCKDHFRNKCSMEDVCDVFNSNLKDALDKAIEKVKK